LEGLTQRDIAKTNLLITNYLKKKYNIKKRPHERERHWKDIIGGKDRQYTQRGNLRKTVGQGD